MLNLVEIFFFWFAFRLKTKKMNGIRNLKLKKIINKNDQKQCINLNIKTLKVCEI